MDKRLDINSVYFHGLESWGFQDRLENSLKRLEAIFQSKAILCRQKQLELIGDQVEFYPIFERYQSQTHNLNGLTHVSICQSQHFDDSRFASAAFNEYIQGNSGMGIILSKDVEQIIDRSRTEVMDGEFQVKDKVPLEYMIGIFCGCKSTQEVSDDLKSAKLLGLSHAEFEKLLPLILPPFHEEIIQKLSSLLFKYNYAVPIYSTRDWHQIEIEKSPVEYFEQEKE